MKPVQGSRGQRQPDVTHPPFGPALLPYASWTATRGPTAQERSRACPLRKHPDLGMDSERPEGLTSSPRGPSLIQRLSGEEETGGD